MIDFSVLRARKFAAKAVTPTTNIKVKICKLSNFLQQEAAVLKERLFGYDLIVMLSFAGFLFMSFKPLTYFVFIKCILRGQRDILHTDHFSLPPGSGFSCRRKTFSFGVIFLPLIPQHGPRHAGFGPRVFIGAGGLQSGFPSGLWPFMRRCR